MIEEWVKTKQLISEEKKSYGSQKRQPSLDPRRCIELKKLLNLEGKLLQFEEEKIVGAAEQRTELR